MAPRRSDLVVSRIPFFAGRLFVQAGEIWDAGDQVVVGNPRAFSPIKIRTSGRPASVVEQAGPPAAPVELDPTPAKRAKGGKVPAGDIVLVGDNGPELLEPAIGGYILTGDEFAGEPAADDPDTSDGPSQPEPSDQSD